MLEESETTLPFNMTNYSLNNIKGLIFETILLAFNVNVFLKQIFQPYNI